MPEGLEIALFIIGDAFFPTGKEDPNPFEGQGSYCDRVSFAPGQLSLIKTFSPGASGN
jgi:hypothetical protein